MIIGGSICWLIQKWRISFPRLRRLLSTLMKFEKAYGALQFGCFISFTPRLQYLRKYLLVAVQVLDGEGFIVTAFFTDKVKRGGLIWKKNR